MASLEVLLIWPAMSLLNVLASSLMIGIIIHMQILFPLLFETLNKSNQSEMKRKNEMVKQIE